MVSDFKRKKFLHVFNAIFDTNKSGSIDKKDFDLAMAKIASKRGYKPGDVTYQILDELLQAIWTGLQQEGDTDGDGEISTDEWIALWDKYSQDPDGASEWQKLYSKCIFRLQDSGLDGVIDVDEYSSVFESFGLDKQKSVEAFKKLSKGKDKVTEAEFDQLWKEYFQSENPEDAGNYIFSYLLCEHHLFHKCHC